jgi:metabolite-proton symporter
MTEPRSRTQLRRAVASSYLGSVIEYYDFLLYATASAVVFNKVFFSELDPLVGTVASFGTLATGYLARPLGGVLFGHYGDRIGRKAALITTLLLMGIGTALIGVLPGYAAIGIAAPLLLTFLRLLQGIAVGGEWGGSVLLAMEWGSRKRRGFMASWPQLGVPLGLLLSTAMVQVMSGQTGEEFLTWGWRVPFLVSLLLVAVGLYVRLRVLESPEFAAVKESKAVAHRPVADVIRRQWRDILTSAFVRMAEQAPFYLFITFVLTYGTKELKLERTELLTDTLIAAAIGLVSVPLFGHLSDVIGRKLMYGIGVVATGLFAFPYFGLLNTRAPGLVLLAIVLSLIFHDMMYGPQAALIAETFGTNLRYSGAGLGYQLASVIAGGPAPLIAAAILQNTGSSFWISVYIVGCAVVSLVALAAMRRDAPDDVPAPADG